MSPSKFHVLSSQPWVQSYLNVLRCRATHRSIDNLSGDTWDKKTNTSKTQKPSTAQAPQLGVQLCEPLPLLVWDFGFLGHLSCQQPEPLWVPECSGSCFTAATPSLSLMPFPSLLHQYSLSHGVRGWSQLFYKRKHIVRVMGNSKYPNILFSGEMNG